MEFRLRELAFPSTLKESTNYPIKVCIAIPDNFENNESKVFKPIF